MRKVYFLVLFALTVQLFLNPVKAQTNIIDEVVWVIGDDAIFRSDVEKEVLNMQMSGERLNGDPYCVIPEQMAMRKLFLHQAKLDSISAPESQVLQSVEYYVNEKISQAGSREKLEEYTGKTISQLRDEYKEFLRDKYTMEQMQSKIVGTIKITPADVRRYYSRLPQDSLPFMPTTIETQIIVVNPEISLSEIDDVKNRLREFTDQITKGEATFSYLARMYSEDKVTAVKGGELGFVGKGTLMPEFAAVAFDLNDPKKVSRIVETDYGFHIIQLIEKRGDRINCRHILLKPKVSKEELRAATNKIDSLRNDILANKFTFDEATTLSFDKATRMNNGLMVNQEKYDRPTSERTNTSRFEMDELPAEVAIAVAELKVGEISKPFKMINENTKEVIVIAKLKSRTEGHKANLADDYQALKALVEAEKRQELLNKWIAKKQKDTYIRINDNWKNCDFQLDGWIKE